MARSKTTQADTAELDPWELEEEDDGSPDPWDVPDEKPSGRERKAIVPSKVVSEDAQMRASKLTEDEWAIKWPDSDRKVPAFELVARAKREKFLNILSKTGSPKKAAMQVQLTPRALYLARDRFPDFKKNWEIAMEVYYMFEAEEAVRHRAIDGTLEPIYYQGNICGYKRVYDSGLTQFWYKNNMREKYGEKSEININGNVNYGVAMLPPVQLDASAWERQAAKTVENQQRNMIDITAQVVDVTPAKPVKVER